MCPQHDCYEDLWGAETLQAAEVTGDTCDSKKQK
jgi:hypothetical protein